MMGLKWRIEAVVELDSTRFKLYSFLIDHDGRFALFYTSRLLHNVYKTCVQFDG